MQVKDTQVWSLEEEMATHTSILARKIPWTEEPGGLQSIGLHRVRRDWATKLVCHLWKIILQKKKNYVVSFSQWEFPNIDEVNLWKWE